MTPELIAIIIITVLFAVAVTGAILWVLKSKRDSAARYNAGFSKLPGVPWARWKTSTGAFVTSAELSRLSSLCILARGLLRSAWTDQQLDAALKQIYIVVRPETVWIDVWGRKVGGIAYPLSGSVEIGCDFAALCHELAEIVFQYAMGSEDWQASEWPGKEAVARACADFDSLIKASSVG